MELTTEDRHRIEQATIAYTGGYNQERHDSYIGFVKGAEYATIYERELQNIPKWCTYCGGNGFTLGYENVHVNCKHCNGSGEQTVEAERTELDKLLSSQTSLNIDLAKKVETLEKEVEQNNDVGKLANMLQATIKNQRTEIAELEVERSELRNKVDKMEELLKQLHNSGYLTTTQRERVKAIVKLP